jgi:acetoacetate decarboxylase
MHSQESSRSTARTSDRSAPTTFALCCRFGDMEGHYLIHTVHSTDGHVHAGRDSWGGPKKFGTGQVFHDGDRHFAYSERLGRRLIEIEAELDGPELAPQTSTGKAFALKMFPSATGYGLEYPPLLNIWDSEETAVSLREGTGRLRWGQSEHDPVDTIPIVSVNTVRAVEAIFLYNGLTQVQIEDPDNIYARYYWGTYMDDPTLEGIPARWRDELEVNGYGHSSQIPARESVAP